MVAAVSTVELLSLRTNPERTHLLEVFAQFISSTSLVSAYSMIGLYLPW